MAENRQTFRVSQKTEIDSVKRQIDFQIEKTDKEARITLQIQEDSKRVLNISVYKTAVEESAENKYYKFTINIDSALKNFRVELATEILDLTRIDFNWFTMPERTLAKLIEERGLEYVVKQFTMDLLIFIETGVGIKQ
uniref:Uncharacterized protein n=1 Tax=Thermofilum adornatum TaxID=1365176 RepID=A0A7C1GAV2_9CREN